MYEFTWAKLQLLAEFCNLGVRAPRSREGRSRGAMVTSICDQEPKQRRGGDLSAVAFCPLPPLWTRMVGGAGAPQQNLLGRSLPCSPRPRAPPTSAWGLALPLPAEALLPSAAAEPKPELIRPPTLFPCLCRVRYLLVSLFYHPTFLLSLFTSLSVLF